MIYLCLGEYQGLARIDAFLGYCVARLKRESVEFLYRVYVTNALQLMPQNKYLKDKWCDIIKPPEDIDPQKVVDDIVKRAGLVVK